MRLAREIMSKYKDESKSTTTCTLDMDKSMVIQQTKIFNEPNVTSYKCIEALTRLVFIIEQGTVLDTEEATTIFFSITRLFQFKHPILRRLCHISIKLLSGMANDIIIATSCLMKDMTGDDQFIRASAIRALCAITDASMLPGIERYVKQAIVDRNSGVSSAALVSSIRFIGVQTDFIKRWMNEISELCKNDSSISQYHAIGLFFLMKQQDKLAISKMVSNYSKTSQKIMPSALLMIRMSVLGVIDHVDGNELTQTLDFLESCLHNRNEIVVYEACRAIVSLKNVPVKYLTRVTSVMRVFLGSPKTIVRYSAVSTLSFMSSTYPAMISECSLDLEALLTDNNKSLATFAVTALLKLGGESNIDRIIKLISSFLSEINESFRIVIVREIRNLAIKYPAKSQLFLNFITSMLREEGGLEYKRGLVDLVITIIHESKDLKEAGLLLLCEFIEDCEHIQLLNTVLNILSKEGPSSSNPSQYIRYIYNRIMLESSEIRAAAIVCMANFAVALPSLRPSVLVLIKRCFNDNDDEVRDRACFYYTLLQNESNFNLVSEVPSISPEAWIKALEKYIEEGDNSEPFNVLAVEKEEKTLELEVNVSKRSSVCSPPIKEIEEAQIVSFTPADQVIVAVGLSESQTFSHVAPPQILTDNEAEFYVQCFKHMFHDFVVFEYLIKNTLEDRVLKNVKVRLTPTNDFKIVKTVDCNQISSSQTGKCFVSVRLPQNPTLISESFETVMVYSLVEADLSGYSPPPGETDEYPIENSEISVSDHFKPYPLDNFDSKWEEISEEFEVEETCALDSYDSIKESADIIVKLTGLQVFHDEIDAISEKTRAHRLMLSGTYRTDQLVLAKLDLKLDRNGGVLLRMIVRCHDPNVSENIFSILS